MAVLVRSHDNVVTIPTLESLKMLGFSVVWGSWILIKNTAVRIVSPLWSIGKSNTIAKANFADSKTSSQGSDKGEKRQVFGLGPRDLPPPCLSTTIYGIHSYVKIKVKIPII